MAFIVNIYRIYIVNIYKNALPGYPELVGQTYLGDDLGKPEELSGVLPSDLLAIAHANRPRGAAQPRMAVIERRPLREWIARMQVERNAQLRHRRPERAISRVVVIDDGLLVADLREAVDHHAFELQLRNRARELAARRVGILQGDCRKPGVPIRMPGDAGG